ncbi:cyclophilin-like domain-containing protein, partial [Russula brevipes]
MTSNSLNRANVSVCTTLVISIALENGRLPLSQFDVAINSRPTGRIVFQLFDDVIPRTVQNFRELATRQHGFGYAERFVHRIIPDVRVLLHSNGTGGRSVYGEEFDDEDIKLKHDKVRRLSMPIM